MSFYLSVLDPHLFSWGVVELSRKLTTNVGSDPPAKKAHLYAVSQKYLRNASQSMGF